MRVRSGNMLGKGCRVGRIAASVVRRARAVPLGIKHDLRRVGGLCALNGTRTQAYQTPPNSAAVGGRQLHYWIALYPKTREYKDPFWLVVPKLLYNVAVCAHIIENSDLR